MPPKPKFTKEEIAETALQIIKEEGVGALTARSLGAALGTSARPIFTAYQNMDEVKNAARRIALREFEAYAGDFENYTPAFKRIGMLMVSYAVNEPEMFKLLFMQEHNEPFGFQNTINDLGDLYFTCIDLVMNDYALEKEDAVLLFEQMWTLAYGLGSMCAMKVYSFSEEEIGERLSVAFAAHRQLHAFGYAGRYFDGDYFVAAHYAFAAAMRTFIGNDLAFAAAYGTRSLCLHLTKNGALHLGYIARAVAIGT